MDADAIYRAPGGEMTTYEDPTIVMLGTVAELTQAKCGGSGDALDAVNLTGPVGVDPSTCSS